MHRTEREEEGREEGKKPLDGSEILFLERGEVFFLLILKLSKLSYLVSRVF